MRIQLIALLALILLSCTQGEANLKDENIGNYHITREQAEKGIVKVFQEKGSDKTTLYYDVLHLFDKDLMTLVRYNEQFVEIRRDTISFTEKGLTWVNSFFIENGTNKSELKFGQVRRISFNPNDKELKSDFVCSLPPDILLKQSQIMTLIGQVESEFNGEMINCIRYDFKANLNISEESSGYSEDRLTEGYMLYGLGVGWFYSTMTKNRKTTETNLLEIISIEAFIQKKL